jgi:hypothetical protein
MDAQMYRNEKGDWCESAKREDSIVSARVRLLLPSPRRDPGRGIHLLHLLDTMFDERFNDSASGTVLSVGTRAGQRRQSLIRCSKSW